MDKEGQILVLDIFVYSGSEIKNILSDFLLSCTIHCQTNQILIQLNMICSDRKIIGRCPNLVRNLLYFNTTTPNDGK